MKRSASAMEESIYTSDQDKLASFSTQFAEVENEAQLSALYTEFYSFLEITNIANLDFKKEINGHSVLYPILNAELRILPGNSRNPNHALTKQATNIYQKIIINANIYSFHANELLCLKNAEGKVIMRTNVLTALFSALAYKDKLNEIIEFVKKLEQSPQFVDWNLENSNLESISLSMLGTIVSLFDTQDFDSIQEPLIHILSSILSQVHLNFECKGNSTFTLFQKISQIQTEKAQNLAAQIVLVNNSTSQKYSETKQNISKIAKKFFYYFNTISSLANAQDIGLNLLRHMIKMEFSSIFSHTAPAIQEQLILKAIYTKRFEYATTDLEKQIVETENQQYEAKSYDYASKIATGEYVLQQAQLPLQKEQLKLFHQLAHAKIRSALQESKENHVLPAFLFYQHRKGLMKIIENIPQEQFTKNEIMERIAKKKW